MFSDHLECLPVPAEEVVSVNDPVLPNIAKDDFLGGNAGEVSLELLRFIVEILFFGTSSGGLSSLPPELSLSKSRTKKYKI